MTDGNLIQLNCLMFSLGSAGTMTVVCARLL